MAMKSSNKSFLVKIFTLLVVSTTLGCTIAYGQSEMKMMRPKHQPIIKVQINGKPAFLLVDTGSAITLIDENLADKYGFDVLKMRARGYQLTGLSSTHKDAISIASDLELQIGGKKMKGTVKVFDLSRIAESISEKAGIRIAGILGSDIMRRHQFVIDYRAREVTLGEESIKMRKPIRGLTESGGPRKSPPPQ